MILKFNQQSVVRALLYPVLGLLTLVPVLAAAGALEQALDTDQSINAAAAKTQKKIETLDDQTRAMLDEYRQVMRELENLQTYNAHSQRIVDEQEKDLLSSQQQLLDIEVTRQEILPLMLKMQDNLQRFVALDTPFLPKERSQRMATLEELMDAPESGEAEKFRRLLEAFQIENDYGYSLEVYRDELEVNGVVKPVDFLRLGRVALYYQTLDGQQTGIWSAAQQQWLILPESYRKPVRDGIRIANKEAPPDLLALPVPAPEVAQ